MDLSLSESEILFRNELRALLDSIVPDDFKHKTNMGIGITKEEHSRWHNILYRNGLIAPRWPKEDGGQGWSAIQHYILDRELTKTPAPLLLPFNVQMVGPVIRAFGTRQQKQRFLPSILDGTVLWCQGYSEPGAGSDLASLRTSAIREGDHYVVNGQKTWTSYAHWADWIFCLVRTSSDGKPQQGISFLLIDMATPGITVRPIITIDGHHHLNEIFLDDVRVPVENLIGEENKGWNYAKFLLGHERTGLAGTAETQMMLEKLRDFAATRKTEQGSLLDQPDFNHRLIALEAKLKALEITELRCLAQETTGAEMGPEASILKLVGTELQQTVSELGVEAMGLYANAHIPEAQLENRRLDSIGPAFVNYALTNFLFRRAATIYGGSDEVQRTVIAKTILGL